MPIHIYLKQLHILQHIIHQLYYFSGSPLLAQYPLNHNSPLILEYRPYNIIYVHIYIILSKLTMGNECCSKQMPQDSNMEQIVPYSDNRNMLNPSSINPNPNQVNTLMSQTSVKSQLDALKEHGNITLPDGSTYQGMIKAGVPHGTGTETHESGDTFTGSFKQGVKSGYGTYIYSNGTVYKGDFRNGDMDGFGRMEWINGDWYEGGFKNSIINGAGTYYSKANNSTYQGTYLQGKRHGKGKITSNNTVLQGYWENGEFVFKKFVPFQG